MDLVGLTSQHLTEIAIIGGVLVVVGILLVVLLRWRRGRADDKYFDSLAEQPYATSIGEAHSGLTVLAGGRETGGGETGVGSMGFKVTSLEPEEPPARTTPDAVSSAPVDEARSEPTAEQPVVRASKRRARKERIVDEASNAPERTAPAEESAGQSDPEPSAAPGGDASLSQAADDAMAELDRLLGNN